jgi:hypothetical protein
VDAVPLSGSVSALTPFLFLLGLIGRGMGILSLHSQMGIHWADCFMGVFFERGAWVGENDRSLLFFFLIMIFDTFLLV